MAKKALIVVNLAGFLCFLRNDFELLKSMGYESEVAADGRMSDGSEAVELSKLRDAGIPFHQIDIDSKNPLSKESLGAYKQLRTVIREGRFDFITCHTPISGLLTRVAAQRERQMRGTKVIYTTHGFAFCKGTSWKSWMVYFPMKYVMSVFCDAIVTINNEDWRNAERMLCKRMYQLPGVGVDIDRIRMDAGFDRDAYRAFKGMDSDDVMALSVVGPSVRNNYRIITEALRFLPDRQRYAYIICSRDTSSTRFVETLKRRTVELSVRVKLLGHKFDLPKINQLRRHQDADRGHFYGRIRCTGNPRLCHPGKIGYLCNVSGSGQAADCISSLTSSTMRVGKSSISLVGINQTNLKSNLYDYFVKKGC